MSLTEAAAFIYICSQADTRSGIWQGSAGALSGELGIPPRTARDVLERMEHGDYIRRFAVPGRHVCYPILVHKFPITQGEHNGEQLNALESKSSVELSYLSREQHGEHGVEHGAAQRTKENREARKNQHPASASPAADSLELETKQSAFDVVLGTLAAQGSQARGVPSLAEDPMAEYPAIMTGLERFLTCEQWSRGIIPHPSTWLNKRRWQDEDVPQVPVGGSSNGRKPNVNDAIETTLATMRAAEQARPS